MFKFRNTLAALATCTALLVPQVSAAQGVPTVDTRSILQQIQIYEQLLKDAGIQTDQLTALADQITLLEEELAKLDEINALLSDPTQVLELLMGDELDGLLEGDFTGNIIDVVQSGARGDWSGIADGSSGKFAEIITSALETAGTSQEEITAMAQSDNELAQINATATASGAATSAAAEIAYEEAGQSVERVTVLVEEIGNMDTLKKAVDHNTRVTAELAIAMAAMWQLESVQTMNNGMGGVLDAASLAEIQKFTDFSIPDFE